MDRKTKRAILKVCEWIETRSEECAQKCVEICDDSAERIQNYASEKNQVLEEAEIYGRISIAMDKVHDEVLSEKYCSDLELKPKAGFAFSVAYAEKNKRIEEIYSEIEKKGLLKKSLSALEKYNLSVTDRQKIGMLLANCGDDVDDSKIVSARLVFEKNGPKTPVPVKVAMYKGKIREITLIERNDRQK